MSLTRYEMETSINYNDEEDLVSIYTASPVTYRKCKRMGFLLINTQLDKGGNEISWTFETTKSVFRWNKKRVSNMSLEQKQKLTERLAASQANKKSLTNKEWKEKK